MISVWGVGAFGGESHGTQWGSKKERAVRKKKKASSSKGGLGDKKGRARKREKGMFLLPWTDKRSTEKEKGMQKNVRDVGTERAQGAG